MKLGPRQLGQLISAIVKEELKRQLPVLIRECLTERYLRNIVAEQARPVRKSKLAEALDEDEDETPGPLNNDHEGIYQDNPMAKGSDDEELRQMKQRPKESKLLASDNPLSFLYEGVGELPKSEMAGLPNGGVGVPIEKMGGDFGRMKELLDGMNRTAANKRPVTAGAPVAEKKFDPKLDTPVTGGPARQPQQPSWAAAQRMNDAATQSRRTHPNIEGDVFPDRPIVLEE